MNNTIFKNLALVIISLFLFFVSLVMIVSIVRSNTNASKLVNIDSLEDKYYLFESDQETTPNLKVILETPNQIERKLQTNEMQATYLGVVNDFDQFKVIACNNNPNCTNSLIMKINKSNTNYIVNKNYGIKADISKDLKINIKEVNSL